MDVEQTAQLIIRIKGLWQDQAGDSGTVAAWSELLEHTEYEDARQAVMERARGAHERPSAAQLYHGRRKP
jgi:hypothetical protein